MADFGDILRVVPSLKLGLDVTIQNSYHVKVTEAEGVDDEDALTDMADYMEDIYGELNPSLTDVMTYEEIKVTNVTTDVDIGLIDWPSLTTGGAATETYAPGVAGLVLANTGDLRHQGRKFFGPYAEGPLTDGLFNSANVTRLGDAATEAYNTRVGTSGATYQPVIVDRETGEARPVTTVQVTANPAYQRRRRAGRGV